MVSLTQPQEIPEDQDPSVNAYVETSKAAWAEWDEWQRQYNDTWRPELPALFDFPEGATSRMIEENGEGTYSVVFRDDDNEIIEIRAATEADVDAYGAAWDAPMLYQSKYDFNYGCFNEEMEAKLEEIAAKHGLRLRKSGEQTYLYSRDTFQTMDDWFNAKYGTNLHGDYSGPQYLTNAEITQRIASQCCHGDFFRETPLGFDKFYAFDEGSFGVCWFVVFTPERQVTCFVYNAAYGTLFSGREVSGVAYDLDSFTERSHSCPDGTVFTVLESPEQTYFYTYLPNSYLCGTVGLGLTADEIDAVLDSVIWSNIGK